MQRGDGGDEAEAKAAPACVPGAVEPVKWLRDELALAGRNAGPIIANLRNDNTFLLPCRHMYAGAGSRVPKGVFNQVGEELRQQAFVPFHPQQRRDFGRQFLRLFLGHRE